MESDTTLCRQAGSAGAIVEQQIGECSARLQGLVFEKNQTDRAGFSQTHRGTPGGRIQAEIGESSGATQAGAGARPR